MKRTVCVILAALLGGLALCWLAVKGWNSYHYWDYGIPRGYTAREEHFDKDAFMDCTDYCKYFYASAEPFEKDGRYRRITEADAAELKGYFADFCSWMRAADRLEEYDFDDGIINAGDFVYLRTKEGQPMGRMRYGKYDFYTICFFDVESCVLYYIHSNT